MIKILTNTTGFAKKWNYFNLAFGIFTCIAFSSAPIFSDVKELPYGFYCPGINKLESPYFQIIYALQMVITPVGCHLYIPLSNLFVISMMFGTTMCRILQFGLQSLYLKEDSEKVLINQIVWCISYQRKLIRYIKEFNILISILFLIEFAMYGIILCALLFLMATISDFANVVIVSVYIITMLSQISAFAWFANELYDEVRLDYFKYFSHNLLFNAFNVFLFLRFESLAVGDAAYNCYWYNYTTRVKMTLSMLILRSQRPLAIRMGDIYDMNLQSLQSLLNVTYTTFTLLKRVYRNR
ncbi:odorant receptor 49b-like [Condylostylus longicornis]|uniref:odorant receptor 49b-like n=1 Tax=Condylostylus longicornis TaxID=2530218 RepID=UPI00244DD6D8|nr:odorant receptor 49b-like [Condylostylus longicornis]